MKKNILLEIGIALLILLFAYTSVSKFIDYDKFVFQMKLAPVPLMKTMAPYIGILLPLVEAALAVSMLFERPRMVALYAALTLLIIFESYITYMLLSGVRLPCTCGGLVSKMSWKQHLLFNAAYIYITIKTITTIKRQGHSITPGANDDIKELSRA